MKNMLITLLLTCFWTIAAVASESKLLKVDLVVQEDGEPTTIQLNFPISMIATMAPQLTEALDQIHAEGDKHQIDLHQIWRDVRDAGPNEFVNVKGQDGHVRVSTDETMVTITIDSVEEGNIVVKVPLELGDLLFGTEATASAEAVLAALENWEGDLVTISGTKANGRIWIE